MDLKNKARLIDVDIIVTKYLKRMVKEASGRVIDWNAFRNYCIEIGNKNQPNILTIPITKLNILIERVKHGQNN